MAESHTTRLVAAFTSGIASACAAYFIAMEATGGWCISHTAAECLAIVAGSVAIVSGAMAINNLYRIAAP